MTRSVFGWSYPPGCSGPPDDDYDMTCLICHGDPETDTCSCIECKECGVVGDPDCINVHMSWQEWPHFNPVPGEEPEPYDLEADKDNEQAWK